MSKRILAEQLDYVIAQRNLDLARRRLRTTKKREGATEEEIQKAKDHYDRVKAKSDLANEAIKRSGLSKSGI